MSSTLSAVPIARRRRAAATLGLVAMVFIAVGAVAATAASTLLVTVFVAIAFGLALFLALLAWGVARSVQLDQREREVDAAIEAAVAAQGSTLRDLTCGCGHDHDPSALQVPDDPCAHDGSGHECSRTCDTCVFARLERTAAAPRVGAAAGPSPRPRPRPRPTPR